MVNPLSKSLATDCKYNYFVQPVRRLISIPLVAFQFIVISLSVFVNCLCIYLAACVLLLYFVVCVLQQQRTALRTTVRANYKLINLSINQSIISKTIVALQIIVLDLPKPLLQSRYASTLLHYTVDVKFGLLQTVDPRTGDPGTKDSQGPAGDQQSVELYTFQHLYIPYCSLLHTFTSVMANCIVITTSITTFSLSRCLIITSDLQGNQSTMPLMLVERHASHFNDNYAWDGQEITDFRSLTNFSIDRFL